MVTGRSYKCRPGWNGFRPTHRTEADMRRLVLWFALPAASVVGVALWFTLVPGRSGAG
jgi:hypothetical protein